MNERNIKNNNKYAKKIGLRRMIASFLLLPLLSISAYLYSQYAHAAITKEISYQGKLTNAAGVSVADGNYSMVISLYTAASGGTPVWTARGTVGSPTARTVTVTNGIFSIMLGDTAAGDNAIALDFNSTYYLGIKVGSDTEMTPRKKVGASGYAFNADMLDGLDSATSGANAHIVATDASGNLTVSGDVNVNGGDINSTTTLTLNPTGNLNFQSASYYVNESGQMVLNTNETINGIDINAGAISDVTTFSSTYLATGASYVDIIGSAELRMGGTSVLTSARALQNITSATIDNIYIDGTTIGHTSDTDLLNLASNVLTVNGTLDLNGPIDLDVSVNDYAANFYNSNTGAAAGGLYIRTDGAGNLLTLNASGTDVMTISSTQASFNVPTAFTASGDVSMAYDLIFTNQTASNIKTNAPFTIEVGELFESNDLTLRTFNNGDVVLDAAGGVTLMQAQPWMLASGTSALNFQNSSGTSILNIDSTNNRVGIGTTTPSKALHLYSAAASEAILIESDYISAWLELDRASSGTNAAINLKTAGVERFNFGLANDSTENFYIGNSGFATKYFTINTSGNIGLGTTSPAEILDVNGRMRLAQTTAPATTTDKLYNVTGNLYWNGVNLTGGGSLPSGTSGQTLRHNGSGWVANSLLYNNGTNVGIGTTSPGSKLHVFGGAIYQSSVAGAAGYMNTNYSQLASTTNRNPGILVFGGSAGSEYGMDLGYNGAYRTRIFTSGSQDIAFAKLNSPATSQTDFVELMTIKNSGNVGIGTTSPGYLLTLADNNGIGIGAIRVISKDTGTGGAIHIGTGGSGFTGALNFDSNGGNKWAVSNAGNTTQSGTLTVSGTGNSSIAGNVGIGTTSPVEKLHVAGSTYTYLNITSDDTGHTSSDGMTIGLTASTASPANVGLVSVRENWPMVFMTNGSENMRISNTGNVGIGTNNPGAKLNVNGGTTGRYTALRLSHAGGLVNDDISLELWPASSYVTAPAKIIGTAVGGDAAGLEFNVSNLGVLNSAMVIDKLGNVGIGTTSPVARLQSSGAAQVNSPTLGSANGGGLYVTNTDFAYGLLAGVATSGNVWLQAQRTDSTATAYNILLQPSGGNVGIGTSNPGARLDVVGGAIRTNNQLISTIATGTAPLAVTSTTLNTNLNADLLDGQHGSYYATTASISGTDNYIPRFNGTSALENSNIYDNGTNIGIGTTTVPALLTVGSTGQFRVTSAGAVTATTYNGLGLTSAADGFTIAGGTTSRTLSVTGGNFTVSGGGNTLTMTGNSSLNQNLLTTSAPTFAGLTLNGNLDLNGAIDLDVSVNDYAANFYNTNTGAAAGGLYIRTDGTGNLLTLNASGTDVVTISPTQASFNVPTSFTASGDVSMAYDLIFTNQTSSNIKTSSAFTIEVGEIFESNDLTLRTLNSGHVVLDAAGGVRLSQAQTWDLAAGTSALNFQNSSGTSILNIDSTNARIGIGTNVPSTLLHLGNTAYTFAASGMSFGDGDTGLYESADDTLQVYVAGFNRLSFTTNGIYPSANDTRDLGSDSLRWRDIYGVDGFFSGNIGIGTTSPAEILDVNGRMRLAQTTAPATTTDKLYNVTGNLYWNGVNLTGGGALPSGTSGQTLRHNGTSWIANSVLYNNGTNIGIGTTSPGAKLDISGVVYNSAPGVLIQGTSSSTSLASDYASLTFVNSNQTANNYSGIMFSDNAGGNNAAAGIYTIYTDHVNDYGDIALTTKSVGGYTEKMRITSGGNVGIGTTNPGAKLHVYESTGLGGTLGNSQVISTFAGFSGTSNVIKHNEWLYRDAAGTDWLTARLHDGISVDASFLTPGTNTKTWWERDPQHNIQSWGDAASTYLTINAGNVGIGTTNPTKKLQVTDTYNVYVGGSGLGTGANIYADNSMYLGTITANSLNIETADVTRLSIGGTGDFSFNSGQAFLQQSTGNFGIGTTTPGAKLEIVDSKTHVSGDLAGTDALLRLYNNYGVDVAEKGAVITFEDNYLGTTRTTRAAIKGGTATSGNTADGFLAFYTDASGANSMQERMRINYNGNVGIGTTSPGAKLDVVGGAIRTNNQLISTIATGTAPLSVASTTLVTNLNADLLDGHDTSYFQTALTNPVTGTGTNGYNAYWTGTGTIGAEQYTAVTRGGTGVGTFTTGGILYGNGTSAIQATAVMTNGQLLIGDGTGAPTLATLTQGNAITVTNGAGSISIGVTNDSIGDTQLAFNTGQHLTTTSSPTFAGLTINGSITASGGLVNSPINGIGENVWRYSSFESSLANMTPYHSVNSNSSVSTDRHLAGLQSLTQPLTTSTTTGYYGHDYVAGDSGAYELKPNTTYTFSAWAYITGDAAADAMLQLENTYTNVDITNRSTTVHDQWVQLWRTFTTPAAGSTTRALLYAHLNTGTTNATIYWDKVMMVEGDMRTKWYADNNEVYGKLNVVGDIYGSLDLVVDGGDIANSGVGIDIGEAYTTGALFSQINDNAYFDIYCADSGGNDLCEFKTGIFNNGGTFYSQNQIIARGGIMNDTASTALSLNDADGVIFAGPISGITTASLSGQITSTLATGTAPFAVTSTTLNTNLNADLLDGQHGAYYASATSISGTDNYIPRFNGTSALENSNIYDNGTNIGIGTTTPGAKLDVRGGISAGTSGTQFVVSTAGLITAGTWNATSISDAYIDNNITISGGTIGSNNISGTLTTTGALTIGDNGDNIVLSGANVDIYSNGSATFGTTSSASNTIITALSSDSYNAGFEAYGLGQGTGYFYAGQSTTHGGGIFYSGDGTPAFATGEGNDRISFYRRNASVNEVAFSYAYSSNDVTFRGNVFSELGISTYDTTVADNTIETGQLCLGNGTNCITSWTNAGGNVDGSGTLNYLSKWTPDGNTIGNSIIYDNGTNIGIGTTSPGEKLEIGGGNLRVWNDNELGGELTSWVNNPSHPYETFTTSGTDITSAINTTLYGMTYTQINAVAGELYKVTFNMTLNSGAMPTFRVGPSSTLTVYALSKTITSGSNTFYFYAAATGNMYVGLYTASGAATDYSVSGYSLQKVTGGNVIASGQFTGGGVSGLKIDASGNVGIGTTTPGALLDVVGGAVRTNNQLISTIATGTAPLSVASTTVVTNLNADMVDGYHLNQNVLTSSSPTFAGLTLNGNLALGGNTITTSNTGLISNLNADLLDGQHGSYYDQRVYSSATNYLGGGYVSGGLEKPNWAGFGAGKLKLQMLSGTNIGGGGTWNDVLWLSSYTGSDVKGSYALVFNKYADEVGFIRQAYDATDWGTYQKLWHTGNDGSGSTLDADLLDGHDTSYFQTALTNPVTGTGTNGYNAYWTGTNTIGAEQYTAVSRGGTGVGTLTTGGILYGNGTSAIQATAVMTNGQLLIGDGTGAPTLATLTQGNAITVTNGAGSISIGVTNDSISDTQLAFNTGQHLTTTSSPTFAGLTINGSITASGGLVNSPINGIGENVWRYSSFESSLANMTPYHSVNSNSSVSTDRHLAGLQSLTQPLTTSTTTGYYGHDYVAGDSGAYELKPNTTYTFSAWAYITGDVAADAMLQLENAYTNVDITNRSTTVHDQWVQLWRTFTTPAAGSTTRALLYAHLNTGTTNATIYWDKVMMVEGDMRTKWYADNNEVYGKLNVVGDIYGSLDLIVDGGDITNSGVGIDIGEAYTTGALFSQNNDDGYFDIYCADGGGNDLCEFKTGIFNNGGTFYSQNQIIARGGIMNDTASTALSLNDADGVIFAGPISGITTASLSGQITSTLATGTAPFAVTSTTLNTNLNADLLDGQHGAYYASATSISGTDNYIPRFNGTSALENSIIYDNGTNIGIGTTTPGAKLDVRGGINAGTSGTQFVVSTAGLITAGTWNATSISDAYIDNNITISGGTIGSNNISGTLTTTGALTIGDNGDNIVLSGANVDIYSNGSATFGTTSSASNTIITALSSDSYNAGFEAYGLGQGTGYFYAGQSTTHGGGIFYSGDGTPAFATGENNDRVSFYRRNASVNEVAFSYAYSSNDVTFRGNVFSELGISTYDTTVADNTIETGQLCLGNGTNCITSWTNAGGNVDGSGTLNYLSKWTPDGNTIGNSIIYDNGTNIGIGTTGPGEKLEIGGGNLRVWNDNELGGELTSWVNNPSHPYETFTTSGTDITSAINTTLYGMAYTQVSAVAGELYKVTFNMTLNSGTMPTFRVGPSSTLTVYALSKSIASGSNTFYFYAAATGNMYVGLYTASGAATDYSVSGYSLQKVTGGNVIASGQFTGGGVSGLKIDASGNVGIGTTTPGALLDVVGGAVRTNNQLISTVATGTAPLSVASTTVVSNFNADMVDGYHLNQNVLTSSSPTFAGLTLNGNLALGGNTITTTNTGLVSNLNADLLDGQHGSYYDQRIYSSATNYLGGGYVSGGLEKPNWAGFGAGKLKLQMLSGTNIGGGGTWNDVLWLSSYTGSDVKGSYALVFNKYADEVGFIRQAYDATDWGTYQKLWHTGNDGSGSTLDADLLDGQHASAFQTALTNPVTGTGTNGYNAYWTGTNTIGAEQYTAVSRGGTGVGTFTTGGILYGNGTSAIQATAVMTNGQLLIGDGSGVPTLATLTQGNAITVTNGAGSISIGVTNDSIGDTQLAFNTGQHLTTTSSPTFAGLTLNGNLVLGSNTITTTNTNVITNLNADLLDGYHGGSYVHIGAYNNTNGYLIATDIAAASDTMFEMDIIGNSYGSLQPIHITIQGYNYNTGNAIINTAGLAEDWTRSVSVFNYNGYLYFWLDQSSSYQSIAAYVRRTQDSSPRNRVTGITNEVKPTTGVTREVAITPKQAWNSGNDGSGSTLDADLLDGHDTSYFQTALTNPVTGTGTNGYNAYWTGTNTIGAEQYTAVSRGGTGVGTLTTGGILYGNGTSAIQATAVMTNGQLLIGDGSGVPTLATLTQGSNIAITNGAGSITIATSATPSFTTINGLTLAAAADGFTISGGTTSRTLTITGSDVAINQNLQTTNSPTFARTYVSGLSTSWGSTNGVNTGGVNVTMGTSSSATWLISGTSGGTFRAGIQALDSNGQLRIYSNSSYLTISGNTISMSGQLTSTLATGTAPLAVTSTTLNTNLNADLLDGQHGAYYATAASISGTDNYIPRFNGTSALENSIMYDTGTNVGIGTTSPGAKLEVSTGALGTSLNDVVEMQRISGSSSNASYIDFRHIRTSAGSDWSTAGLRVQSKVDATWLGYMQFNGNANGGGISFGTGTTTTAPGNVSESMRIDGVGRVGIGTTGPGSKLDVRGGGGGTVDLYVSGRIKTGDGNNNGGVWLDAASTQFVGQYSANTLGIYNNNNWGLVVNNSGSVGMGTTSPGAKLDIQGGSLRVGSAAIASANAGDISISREGDPTSGYMYFGNAGTNYFGYNGSGYTFNAKSTINGSTGAINVGSGISNSTVVIAGTNTYDTAVSGYKQIGALYSSNTMGADVGAGLTLGGIYTGTSKTDFAQIAGIKENATDGNYSGALTLYTRQNGNVALQERMRIDSAGLVGIGTTSPVEALDLNGRLRLAQTTAPADTTNKLYNVSGNLYWNGINLSGGAMPSGTTGQTLRHDGTNWVANSVLYNNGTNIGIGSTSPSAKLDVLSSTTPQFSLGYDASNKMSVSVASSGTVTFATKTMSDTYAGYNNPSSASSSYWSNPTYVYSSDDTYASQYAVGSSGAIQATNFGFSIPTNAIIKGVQVVVEGHATLNGVQESNVQLVVGGVAQGSDRSVASVWGLSDVAYTSGGTEDTWGLSTLTPAVVNASNFGATVTLNSTSAAFEYIDSIRIRVYYSTNYAPFAFTNYVGIGTTAPTEKLQVVGGVRFSNFGAGTLQTDANGVLTVSSDENLKNIDSSFDRGLEAIMNINPISYHWKGSSGLDTMNEYTGFSAQNVKKSIPEAIGVDSRGFLTLTDRPILAAAVNAIKQQQGQLKDLNLKTDANVSSIMGLKESVDQQLTSVSLKFASQDEAISTVNQKIADMDLLLNFMKTSLDDQKVIVDKINEQMELIKSQNEAILDFAIALDAEKLIYKDEAGNIDLLNGKVTATEMVAGVFTVKITDPEARTIGEAIIRSGSSNVEIKTRAVTDNSKIFVTAKVASEYPLAVTQKKSGEGFVVSVKGNVTEDVSFDWWIVESKDDTENVTRAVPVTQASVSFEGPIDSDGDGLIDEEELRIGTNQYSYDTDGDGFLDGDELRFGYNPLVASDGNKGDKIIFDDPKVAGVIDDSYVIINSAFSDNGARGYKLDSNGTVPANRSVTVFVYGPEGLNSTVGTIADAEGNWNITVNKDFADGAYEIYVVQTNIDGSITSKSGAFITSK